MQAEYATGGKGASIAAPMKGRDHGGERFTAGEDGETTDRRGHSFALFSSIKGVIHVLFDKQEERASDRILATTPSSR